MTTIKTCPDCGREAEELTCDYCGHTAVVINCGHYAQPPEVGASETGLSCVCQDCHYDIQDGKITECDKYEL